MWFDILCALIVICGAFYGYRRGALSQLGAIFGVVLGIVCCHAFASPLAYHFVKTTDSIETVIMAKVLANVVIFVVCYIVGRLLGKTLTSITRTLHLNIFNRIGGMIFTVVEYLLILSLVLNVFIGFFPDTKISTRHSTVKKIVLNFAPKVLGCPEVADFIGSVKNSLEKAADNLSSEEQP